MHVVSSRKIPLAPDVYAEKLAKRSAISSGAKSAFPGNKPNFKRVSVKIIGESASVACSSPVATLTLPMRCRWITQRTEAGKQSQCGRVSVTARTYLYLNNSKAPLNQADLRRAFPGLPIIRVWLTAF